MRIREILEFSSSKPTGDRFKIPNVKILGNESVNVNEDGTHNVYPLESRQAALPLYEGASVFLDHPERENPGRERSYSEKLGRIRNVRAVEEGSYGDLILNPHHPLAEQIAWDAANSPDSLGLSHNAQGKGRVDGDKTIIESIVRVRSVDLVAAAATCSSLFEGQREQMDPREALNKIADLVEMVDEAALFTVLTDSATLADEKVSKALRLLFVSLKADADKAPEPAPEPAPPPLLPVAPPPAPAMPAPFNPLAAGAAAADDTESAKDASPVGDELREAQAKIAALEAEKAEAEAVAARNVRRDGLIAESRLPAEVLSSVFVSAVRDAKDDEIARALIEDRKALHFHQEPVSGSKGVALKYADPAKLKTFLEA